MGSHTITILCEQYVHCLPVCVYYIHILYVCICTTTIYERRGTLRAAIHLCFSNGGM